MKKLFLLIPVLVGLLLISCGGPEAVPTPAPTGMPPQRIPLLKLELSGC